jgi:hypothetical protein
MASCALNSGPTKGGYVDVLVIFIYRGQEYVTSANFTTQP